jgi:hypothetical protein
VVFQYVFTRAGRKRNGAGGFRTPTDNSPKTAISENPRENGAESGALQSDFDPDRAFIVDHWHDLPDDVKRSIMHVVRSYAKTPDPEARRAAVQDALLRAHHLRE